MFIGLEFPHRIRLNAPVQPAKARVSRVQKNPVAPGPTLPEPVESVLAPSLLVWAAPMGIDGPFQA